METKTKDQGQRQREKFDDESKNVTGETYLMNYYQMFDLLGEIFQAVITGY